MSLTRTQGSKILLRTIHPSFSRTFLLPLRHYHEDGSKDIKTLEDLVKLKSLDGVDPELIKNLIYERTKEMDVKNELDMLKKFTKEEKSTHDSPLKKFTRPLWVVLLMSSSVYLGCHYLWWRLEYVEREKELMEQVETLENELNTLLATKPNQLELEAQSDPKSQPFYKRWFSR